VTAAAFDIPVGRNRRYGTDLPTALDVVVGGWHMSGVYTYRSGSFLRFGGMVAPQSVTKLGGVGRGNYWFDTTGFSVLPAFTRRANPNQYDNLTGPGFTNLDMMISKRFSVGRGMKAEFRLEAYNTLNTTIWANPNTTITSSDFGQTVAQANSGRRLQYALRLEF
jgi:hypothetical protein